MTPTPTAVGIHLCDYVIVETGTGKPSLIGCFDAMRFEEFPSPQRSFCVAAFLTDGEGVGSTELLVVRQDTGDVVYGQSGTIRFADRLRVVQYGWKVTGCSFPAPGRYEFTMYVDAEWVAQRIIYIGEGP